MAYPSDVSAGDKILASDFNALKNDINNVSLDAGETINGATLPVAVYIDNADGEVKKTDANDTDKVKFAGFAVTNSTDGNPIIVQVTGVVGGFSGLTINAEYYLSDTAGEITTTPSTTTAIKVGVAMSATELKIDNNLRIAAGLGTDQDYTTPDTGSGTNNDNETITLGFQPKMIILSGDVTHTVSNLKKGFGTIVYFGTVAVGGLQYNDTNTLNDANPIVTRFTTTGVISLNTHGGQSSNLTVTLSVFSVSTTGFVIRTSTAWNVNAAKTGSSQNIRWIAIG